MSSVRRQLVRKFLESGNELADMLPKFKGTWSTLLEDLWSAPFVRNMMASLLDECGQHREFESLSIDATVRILMRVRGQENYRAPKHKREMAVIPDAQAHRRVARAGHNKPSSSFS